MMKKFLVLFLFLTTCHCCRVWAEPIPVDMIMEIIDDTPDYPSVKKIPMRHRPHVFIEDHTLSFSKFHPEYVINIVQEDEVVYTAIIPSDVPTFEIPSVINGECTIQLIRGKFCFWGYITL